MAFAHSFTLSNPPKAFWPLGEKPHFSCFRDKNGTLTYCNTSMFKSINCAAVIASVPGVM